MGSFRLLEPGPNIIVDDDALINSGETFYLAPDLNDLPSVSAVCGAEISFREPIAFGLSPDEFFKAHAGGRYFLPYREALLTETRMLIDGVSNMKFNGSCHIPEVDMAVS